MPLVVEAKASQYLGRQHTEQAVLITIYGNSGMPVEALSVELSPRRTMHHDPSVALISDLLGVPVYASTRVAAYACWHALRLPLNGKTSGANVGSQGPLWLVTCAKPKLM